MYILVRKIGGEPPQVEHLEVTEFLAQLQEDVFHLHEKPWAQMHAAENRQEEYFDLKVKTKFYQHGDVVCLHAKQGRKDFPLNCSYSGKGSTSIKVISDVLHLIKKKTQQSKPKIMHHYQLEPFFGGKTIGWSLHSGLEIKLY